MKRIAFGALCLLLASQAAAQIQIRDERIILNSGKTLEQAIADGDLGATRRPWLDVAACNGTVPTLLWDTAPADNPEAVCEAGVTNTGLMLASATFDQSALERMQRLIVLPALWPSGTVSLFFRWHSAATTNEVRWCVRAACFAVGESRDVAWDAPVCVEDTAAGTANQDNLAQVVLSGVSIDTCSASEQMRLELYRDAANVGDDLAGLAYLDMVEVLF